MSAKPLRLVYDADAPPRLPSQRLDSIDELEPLLRRRLDERRDGELFLRGHDTARICLFDGTIAWVRCHGYPEHLGDVLRRELGVAPAALRQVIGHCRATGQRLGEGMLELGLASATELRGCLRRHVTDQLRELLGWPGPVDVEHSEWPHRYDGRFTFGLDELLGQPVVPSLEEQQRLTALLLRCQQRVPDLPLACVIEAEEGTVIQGRPEGDAIAEDLLGLGLVGMRRLLANRVIQGDGAPRSLVLTTTDACVVAEPIPWNPTWLLVLGGTTAPGRLLTVAQAAVRQAP